MLICYFETGADDESHVWLVNTDESCTGKGDHSAQLSTRRGQLVAVTYFVALHYLEPVPFSLRGRGWVHVQHVDTLLQSVLSHLVNGRDPVVSVLQTTHLLDDGLTIVTLDHEHILGSLGIWHGDVLDWSSDSLHSLGHWVDQG